MTPSEIFYGNGYLHLKDILPKELCNYLTHVLIRASEIGYGSNPTLDSQVPTAKAILSHEIVFETVLEQVWSDVEDVLNEEVLPTYAYARLYSNGDILEKHKDRPACEISMTVQLGRSHHYAWPIYMGGNRIDLAEGDGVLYLGKGIEHWRNVCEGPEGYYSGQVFLHYVRKEGENAGEAGDMPFRNVEQIRFTKNSTHLMRSK
jgi:hypothetical protein